MQFQRAIPFVQGSVGGASLRVPVDTSYGTLWRYWAQAEDRPISHMGCIPGGRRAMKITLALVQRDGTYA